MPRFNVSISFGLQTEIEPEGIRFEEPYGHGAVEDFTDNSYFGRTDVDSDGGHITFVVECDTEDEARAAAEEVISDGGEFEDDMSFTWLAVDVSYDIEEIEEPMTLDRAREIVRVWLDGRDQEDELSEALDFLLGEFERIGEKVAEMGREVAELSYKLSAAERKVAELAGELDRLKNGPDGSEAPVA